MNNVYQPLRELTKLKDFRYLYLISSRELGLFKIGLTDDVPRRLSQLQDKSAYPLRVEQAYRVYEKLAPLFETMLHEIFTGCRTHGEWFRMAPEQLAELDKDTPLTFAMQRVYKVGL